MRVDDENDDVYTAAVSFPGRAKFRLAYVDKTGTKLVTEVWWVDYGGVPAISHILSVMFPLRTFRTLNPTVGTTSSLHLSPGETRW